MRAVIKIRQKQWDYISRFYVSIFGGKLLESKTSNDDVNIVRVDLNFWGCTDTSQKRMPAESILVEVNDLSSQAAATVFARWLFASNRFEWFDWSQIFVKSFKLKLSKCWRCNFLIARTASKFVEGIPRGFWKRRGRKMNCQRSRRKRRSRKREMERDLLKK